MTTLSANGMMSGEPGAKTNFAYLVPVCLVATLGGLLFGYDTGVISGAIEPVTTRFHLSDGMKGWASGCALVACAAGVLLAGPISDRLGRRLAMFLAAAMFLISAIGTAIPPDVNTLIVFRIVGGLGIGIASLSTPMYIAELTPAHLRGRMVAVNQIAIVLGMAATCFINYFIAHSHGNPSQPEVQAWLIQSGWRWMFGAEILPALLFGALLVTIPESPRWLIEKGRVARARHILGRVGGAAFADAECRAIEAAISHEQGTWREVFSPALRRPLVLGILLASLQQITGINVFLYFGATIFKTMSKSTGVDAGLLQQAIIAGSGVLFTMVAIATVDRWGRRPLMIIGSIGMGLSLTAMGALAQFSSLGTDSASKLMLACIIAYFGSFSLSVGPVTWVILSEIFPTAVRGRALGLATFFLWMSNYVITQTFPMLDAEGSWFVQQFHHAFPFYLYASFCLVLLIVVVGFVPETKGKTLEEIEKSWK